MPAVVVETRPPKADGHALPPLLDAGLRQNPGSARYDGFTIAALAAAGIVAGNAISDVGGWLLRVELSTAGAVELLPMAPASTIAFLCVAVALGCIALGLENRKARRAAAVSVAVVLGLAVTGFVELIADTSVGVNRWILNAIGGQLLPRGSAGRMPLSTAVAFALAAVPLAVLLMGAGGRPRRLAAYASAAAVALIGLLFTIGYLYDGQPVLYGRTGLSMSLTSALSFLLAGIGLGSLVVRGPALQRRAEAEWLKQANAAKSDFLSRMSHELRTPLNAILGFGQLLEIQVEGAENRESAQQIVKAGRHLLHLIDEVLDLAKIESGRLTLSLEPVSLSQIVDEARDLVRHLAAERQIGVEVNRSELAADHVRADQQRLKQVILNLLSNAIKFNANGGTVAISFERRGDQYIRLLVRDTAGGIPDSLVPRLFTPFDRLGAEARGIEGTGLGLALSRDLVKAMGGAMGIEVDSGIGSTFWVDLPASPPPAVVEKPRRTSGPVVSAGDVSHRVVYIEDNLSNYRLVERILELRPDVTLVGAMQGSIGIDLVHELRPSMILLDVHLPDMTGAAVLDRLQMDRATRNIPVIIISADATARQRERLLASGASGYLSKPIVVEDLLATIDRHLPTSVAR
jgi:signal transduction histidine kinase/ActR/RegA family two-component response regulator